MSKEKSLTTICTVCGKTIATNAKTCPECGAKNKKPIYKRPWFIAIIIIIFLGVIGSGMGDSGTPADNGNGSGTDTSQPVDMQTGKDTEDEVEPVNQETQKPDSTETMGQKNALNKAYDYLDYSAFSQSGLIAQLEFEGFSTDEATYAVNNCGADWNEQAAQKAKDYLDYSSFSRSGLIEQLEFEGFTSEQAEYGATAAGY